jgi:soluble lytic murein transglycosylase
MLRPAFLLATIFFLVQSFPAQTLIETHQRIRDAYQQRNYLAAATELRDLESKDAGSFRNNNYDYLLARVLEKTGETSSAMKYYQGVVSRNSVLKEYALWHLAQIARSNGTLLVERVHLEELLAFSPDSLLTYPARRRIAQSYFDSGNFDAAIRATEQVPPPSRQGSRSADQIGRELQAFLGEAYLRSGNVEKARDIFSNLTTQLANPAQPDDFALAGVVGLDSIEKASNPTQITDYEHLRRASIYQFNRDWEHARAHYAAIITGYPQSGIVPDALFQTGRGYAQQADYTEALKWFERILEQFPEHPIAPETLLQTASAYSRVGKLREATARYRKYIEKYPEGERIDRAYLNIVDLLRDQREETEALKWTATIADKFRGKQTEALAVFAEARIYFARSDWTNALPVLERLEKLPDLGGASVPGGTNLAEVKFLRGFALEQLRRYAEAIEMYLSIPDGRNEYYGWRATEHLRLMSADKVAGGFVAAKANSLNAMHPTDPDAARKVLQASLRLTESKDERERLLSSLRATYAALPAYKTPTGFKLLKLGRTEPANSDPPPTTDRHKAIADELLFLGLYDEAAPEFELSNKPKSDATTPKTATDLEYTLAVVYNRGDLAARGTAFVESNWKMPADYQIELIPSDIIDLLYPAPFGEYLIKHAPQRNVDPRFLLSIMRQESRFRPDVKSYAAARGLMQFISTTASRIAAELSRENFRQDDLYDPGTAILFGAHYTGNLVKLFPHQPPAVAASYNGGEDNVQRWVARSKSDQADRYIPEIAFSQSKDYVYRVMANYRIYQMLYDENLKKR